jgi:hypothetical protein
MCCGVLDCALDPALGRREAAIRVRPMTAYRRRRGYSPLASRTSLASRAASAATIAPGLRRAARDFAARIVEDEVNR